MVPSEQDVLRERLTRYPPDRYPVQHATTQFHLGSALLHAGQPAAALQALATAQQVFSSSGMRLEHAKATVMVGVAHRTAGSPAQAVQALRAARAALVDLDAPADRAAASYNLGLVLQDCADAPGAHEAWEEARELFLVAGHPVQAAAAARDHGASLLADGEPGAALPLLEQAAALAERSGDDAGTAGAANVLGLAHLAAGDAGAAVTVLRRALGFAPRSVRPADNAMVKANLALAWEQDGRPARARLTAVQALAVSEAPPPVRVQARELLQRLGGASSGDLLEVLDEESSQEWPPIVREEVVRATALPSMERVSLLRSFFDGLLLRPSRSYDLAEALLQVVLELPPRPYALMVQAMVSAGAGRPQEDVDRLRAVVGSALARFAIPQWQRLAASLNDAATAAGHPAGWR